LSTAGHGEERRSRLRFIGSRRAISLDPNAAGPRKADVVYIADAFQVIAKLNAKLEAAKA